MFGSKLIVAWVRAPVWVSLQFDSFGFRGSG